MTTRRTANLAVALSVWMCACAGSPSAPSAPVQTEGPAPTLGSPPAVLVGAGDIAVCGSEGSALTAALLDTIAGTIFAAGDNAYPSGRASDYRDCYDPTWGRHRHRTMPTPGNHEYETPAASPYYEYFGANAGPPGRGYYSYDLGAWHIVSLNSEIDVRAGSPQERWLRTDLAQNRTACTAAYWHRPRFSSGPHGDNRDMQDLWRTLYEFNAEIVLAGHDHLYERFAPQDAAGQVDNARGIRGFVVGTGGMTMHPLGAVRPNSEAQGTEWGVLALTLSANSYRWNFVPVSGATYRDSGGDSCH
jgi:hypothetical protein